MITPMERIERLPAISSIQSSKSVETTGLVRAGQEGMFGAIFKNAIQNVKDTDAEFSQAQYLLSTGQLDNPATALIALSKEEVAVNLLIQLRNRALDAYSELTRMSM